MIPSLDHGNLTEQDLKKQRYWGLATLATLWVFISIIAGAAVGQTGTSAITVLWFLVAIYAVTGNISGIFKTAKFVLILQAAVGSLLWLWLLSDSSVQLTLGTPTEFAVGIGISMAAWGVLYLWAKEKNATSTETVVNINKSVLYPTPDGIEEKEQNDFSIIPGRLNRTYEPATSAESEAINILRKYDTSIKDFEPQLDGIPNAIKDRILLAVLNNPTEKPIDIRNRVLLEALGRPDLDWSLELEALTNKLRHASEDDVNEFFRIFPILSLRMPPFEVFNKAIGEKKSELEITGVTGRKTKVTQHGISHFTLESHLGTKTFFTIDEVYDYLGTPDRYRLSDP
jgi:hypothetical protein